MKMKNDSLHIFRNTKEDFNEYASDFLFNRIQEILNSTLCNINIALSGGNTPLPILSRLKNRKIKWERINFFMVDERCVSIKSELSNFGNISKVFFDKIPSKKISMVKEGLSFEESLIEYKKAILENLAIKQNGLPKFDLIVLGMGDDGHTASLFPETEALLEENEIVVINQVPQLNTERMTLTYPIILNSNEIVVIVKGVSKEKIIEELYSINSYNYPISRIVNEHSNLKWLIG